MDNPKFFFSYARADSEFVLKLAKDLRAAGANLWLDQLDIPAGERWDQAIEEALAECRCLIVILSSSSVKSDNVMDEVSYALEEGKQVIPVKHQECKIPFRLRRLQHIDFTSGYDNGLSVLLNILNTELSSGATPTPEKLKDNEKKGLEENTIAEMRKEDVTASPSAKLEKKNTRMRPKKKKGFPLGITALVAALLLIGIGSWYIFKPNLSTVPDLSKLTLENATQKLKDNRLSVGNTTYRFEGASNMGLILNQSLAPESEVGPGATVDLVIGDEGVEVPDLKGKKISEAKTILMNYRFSVEGVKESNQSAFPDTILRQTPKAGTRVAKDSQVLLVIAEPKFKHCEAYDFEHIEDFNGAFVQFNLPRAPHGTVKTWNSGYHTQYKMPTCRGIGWKNIKFTCNDGKWILENNREFYSNALCHGSTNDAQKGLVVGVK